MNRLDEFLKQEEKKAFDAAMACLKHSKEPEDLLARGIVLGRLEMIKKVIWEIDQMRAEPVIVQAPLKEVKPHGLFRWRD